MKKNYKTIGIISLIIIIGIISLFYYIKGGKNELRKNDNESIFIEEDGGESIPLKNKEIVVDVKGAVNRPNIYRLEEGSIVDDAIVMAGGITGEADLSKINRAEKLSDNQEVTVPKINETEGSIEALSKGVSSDGKVNINTANAAELDTLPGVGPARASDIIKYRETNGKFKSIEDIKNIKGIGEASFEKLKDMIKV